MHKIIYNQQSLAIRNKWVTDIISQNPRAELPQIFESVPEWEGVVEQLYSTSTRAEQIQLVVQCKTIGLLSKANELEQSLGVCNQEELKKMYSQID